MNPPQASRWLVPAIAASQFAPPFMISGVAVALPALGADLGAGATALSLVETLFLAAAVAAASAAYIVTGFAVWKNFISRAEDPAFEGLRIPALASSLRSARRQVEHMYTPG